MDEKELEKQILGMVKDLQAAKFGNADWFFLLNKAQEVSLIRGFQQLLSLDDLNIRLYPHQEEAVLQILQQMGGSALIADEVGLGKTIIACTVLCELAIRNLVNSVLIIVPPSLTVQWQMELEEKFNLEIPVVASGKYGDWDQSQFITSINLAALNPKKILNRTWDLIILDEAHRAKNRDTKTWGVLNRLKKKYMLGLTATPMENFLTDIYGIMTLLKPGLFGTYRDFRRAYAVPKNKRGCKDPISLRRQLNTAMIRRRRGEVKGIFFPERVARTVRFDMQQGERELYDRISEYVISSYSELEDYQTRKKQIQEKYSINSERFFKRKIWLHKFTLMLLQRRLCSSATSVGTTLQSMIESRQEKQFDIESLDLLHDLRTLASQVALHESTKYQQVKTILERLPNKAIIFTEFGDSLNFLEKNLQEDGFNFIKFYGGLSSQQRAETVREFQEKHDILISTDAGSEGLNLQFANALINFDLPWNPMRIEQRIGRVYRLTQEAEKVYIFNMASNDTIEQYVLDILLEKIGVFQTILGDLSHLLGSQINDNPDGRSIALESEIMKFFVKHGHSEKLRNELQSLVEPVVEQVQVQDELSGMLDVNLDDYIDTY